MPIGAVAVLVALLWFWRFRADSAEAPKGRDYGDNSMVEMAPNSLFKASGSGGGGNDVSGGGHASGAGTGEWLPWGGPRTDDPFLQTIESLAKTEDAEEDEGEEGEQFNGFNDQCETSV